jgi:choline dehydrogenase-like flavoprotein
MRVIDDISTIDAERFDVCIIGAGPVGLAIAIELGRLDRSVLLLEAGPLKPVPNGEWEVASTTSSNHVPLEHALARGLGGTSSLWGGRCIPLDEHDLSDFGLDRGRAWPIKESELSPFYETAANYLGCGEATFRAKPTSSDEKLLAYGVEAFNLERWCAEPFTPHHLNRKPGSDRVTVVLNLEVKRLEFLPDRPRIAGVVLRDSGRFLPISASQYVLAAGGIGNARILLSTQRVTGIDFGPTLGRYYMGHISGSVGKVVFKNPSDASEFTYDMTPGSAVRRLITISASARTAADIPNIYFYPANPLLADAAHGSGLLSALYLLLRIPLLGRRLVSEGIRTAQLANRTSIWAHIKNIACQPTQSIAGLMNIVWQRIFEGRKKPLLFLISRHGEYDLHYHAEQTAHHESGISLGLDDEGNEVLQDLNLKFREEDFAGVERAHALLAAAIHQSGIGELKMVGDAGAIQKAIADQAKGGFHQIGLTRMGKTAAEGVVDNSCKVFGTDNLFVAGASVFRTSGRANPTFSAVALALRLADHLNQRLG